jgi:hypothetical protein
MSEIKVFRVNDYEWWAGADLESIRTAYKDHTGIDPDSDEGFDSPREITEAGMSKIVICDDGPEKIEQTFRQYLDEMIALNKPFPCFFAGTEC